MDGDAVTGLVAIAIGALVIWNRGKVAYYTIWQNQTLFGVKVSERLARLVAVVIGLGGVVIGVAAILSGWGGRN